MHRRSTCLRACRHVPSDAQVCLTCCVTVSDTSGWIQQLAVELSTDSRTGALSLYERLGMRVRWSFTHWAGDVR